MDILPPQQQRSYRPEIDGLRAIAVIAVVIFHAFPEFVTGGFVGVDVFFVISGFLISGIIFKGLDRGTFSFKDFYSRRIRRIFPALIVVLSATLFLGWFMLLDEPYKVLGKQIAFWAGFLQNFLLWNQAGYFDVASDLKPLLHLWSLAIEEQFYLVFPLLMYFLTRFKWSRTAWISAAFIASFALNIMTYESSPTAAFYNPLSRIWELLLGSLLAIYMQRRPANQMAAKISSLIWNGLSLAGLALIGVSVVVGSKTTPFPGWFALLPTCGAALLIFVGQNSAINRYFLSHRLMRWFGDISYPLYLWHWPLLVLPRVLNGQTAPHHLQFALVLLSVGLSWLTMRFVETPLRFGGKNKLKVWSLVIGLVLVAQVGHRIARSNGVQSRHIVETTPAYLFQNNRPLGPIMLGCGFDNEEQGKIYSVCVQDERELPTIGLLGDSKAASLSSGVFNNSIPGERWLFVGGAGKHGAPVPVISDAKPWAYAQPFIRPAVENLAKHPTVKVVVITAATRAIYRLRTDRHINDLPKTKLQEDVIAGLDKVVRALVAGGKKVIFVVDNPTLPDSRDCVPRTTGYKWLDDTLIYHRPDCRISYAEHMKLSSLYREALTEMANRFEGTVSIYDPLHILCDIDGDGYCPSIRDGRQYYANTDHISDYTADLIGKELVPYVSKIMRNERVK